MPRKSKPIADQLRQLIRQADREGITQYRIAQQTGISEGQLSRLMHHQVNPRLDTAERIARALGHHFELVKD